VRECPRCGGSIEADARICRHCLHIVDREGWQHDAGRLGADGSGGGRELEDPPVEPLPVTGSGLAGGVHGAAAAGLRLVATGLLVQRRNRRGRGDQSEA
jgi:hypothetical protein